MAVLIKTDPGVACHLSLQKAEAGGLPILGQYRLYCQAVLKTTKQQTQKPDPWFSMLKALGSVPSTIKRICPWKARQSS